jgi:hypothetical protein
MSISKTVVKLAAAALVVAGGVGTVWAQSTVAPDLSGVGGSCVNCKQAANGLTASYEVVKKWNIETIPGNATDAGLFIATANDVTVSDVGGTGTKNGNLGIVSVETNSSGWDVKFTTANGGKLAKGTKKMGQEDRFDLGCMCIKPVDTGWVYGNKDYLKYKTTSPTNAVLNVGIGLYDKINGTTYVLKGLATGASNTSYPAALVDPADIVASQTTNADGSATTSPVSVSLYEALNNDGSGAGTALGGAGATTLRGALQIGGVAVSGGAAGFGPTDTELTTGGGAVIPTDGKEYFFINVGLLKTSGGAQLGGNEEGTYEETFTFTLVADF